MIEDAITTLLDTAPGVSAISGARNYAGEIPQEPTFPLTAFSNISNPPSQLAHDAPLTIRDSVYQVDCCARTYTDAKRLANEVDALFRANYKGTVAGQIILGTEVIGGADGGVVDGVYQVSVDVVISHRQQ